MYWYVLGLVLVLLICVGIKILQRSFFFSLYRVFWFIKTPSDLLLATYHKICEINHHLDTQSSSTQKTFLIRTIMPQKCAAFTFRTFLFGAFWMCTFNIWYTHRMLKKLLIQHFHEKNLLSKLAMRSCLPLFLEDLRC